MPYQPGSGDGQVFISRALGQTAASYDQSLTNFAWKAMFPRNANQAAVAAFTHALNMESGKGNGGVEVVECIRCLDLIANKAH